MYILTSLSVKDIIIADTSKNTPLDGTAKAINNITAVNYHLVPKG